MNTYPAYKDSGIEWIGKIPEHWEVKKLKYVIKLNRNALAENTQPDFLMEYIDIGSVSSEGKISATQNFSFKDAPSRARRIVKKGDVIVSTVRTYLKAVAKIDSEESNLIASTGFAVLEATNSINSAFLYHYTKSELFIDTVCAISKGVSYPAISSSDILEIHIWLPEPSEQTGIGNYLDSKTEQIDTLISNKQKLIELLKEERTAIINQAVTKGLNPHAPMKDSGIEWLGEIPEHWEVKKLKYIFNSLNSVRVPLSAEDRGKMENKLYDYYGASGIIDQVDNYLFNEELILIGEDGANLLTRSKRLAFIASGKYWVNNHAHIIKPKRGNIYYLCELLELIDYTIYISGSAQPKLTQEALMSIDIIEPPVEEQIIITQYLFEKFDKTDTLITKTQQEINLLKEYKTALISEVVTGKVDVREEAYCLNHGLDGLKDYTDFINTEESVKSV